VTYARGYQRGIKAFLDGIPLADNPYNGSVCVETRAAWSDGWHDASHASWRNHGHKNAAHSPPHRLPINDAAGGLPPQLSSLSEAPSKAT
jgi:ribosome modulation factor